MFKFLLYKFGQFVVTRLPIQTAYRWACRLSDLQYYLSFRDQRAVKNNLKTILKSDKDLSQQARAVFRNFGKYLVEFFRMAKADMDFVKRQVKVAGLEKIDEVLARGKGAIFLTGHLGNWELGGIVLSLLGYPSVAIALPHKERPVNNLFNAQRESRGMTIVQTSAASRQCLSMLKANKIVAVVADRCFGASALTFDFFGRPTAFPKGPAIFSLKTGAAILPTFLFRQDDDRFSLEIGDPIYPPVSDDGRSAEEKVFDIMKQYVAIIADKIRTHPTQWLMFREYGFEDNEEFRSKVKKEEQHAA